jgi:tetratricopeptide (TPR) repeat protein
MNINNWYNESYFLSEIRKIMIKVIWDRVKTLSLLLRIMMYSTGVICMTANASNLENFDKLWNYNKPDETEKKFRELLNSAENSKDKSYYLELLTQIARTEGLQNKFAEANKTLDEVEKMLTDDLKTAKIRYLLERGRVYNSSGAPEKAVPYFTQAWETATSEKQDFYAIDAVHMLAIADAHDKQLDWNLKALEMIEKSDDQRAKKWAGSLYNNIGWTYHDNKQYDKALKYFEKGVQWHEDNKSGEELIIAKWTVARTLRSMNKPEEALKIQKALIQERKEKGLEEDGYIFEEIGECLLNLKN